MNPYFFNLSQRKKRDILTDLLEGRTTEGIIGQRELHAIERLVAGPPADNTPVKRSDPASKTKKFTVTCAQLQLTKKVTAAGKNAGKAKRKKTHYLSHEISENLDRTQLTIRALVPEELRYTISKSLIVNKALAMILREFKAGRENSRLMRSIIQKT